MAQMLPETAAMRVAIPLAALVLEWAIKFENQDLTRRLGDRGWHWEEVVPALNWFEGEPWTINLRGFLLRIYFDVTASFDTSRRAVIEAGES